MTADSLAIQAVVFDLDDTLYAERDYVRSGYVAVGEHLRRRLGRQDAFEEWLWDRFRGGRSAGALDALNEEFRIGLRAPEIAELVEVYRTHLPRIAPRPGAAALLARLHGQFRLGLLTDGFLPAQRLKLDALGLAGLFDAVIFTEGLGRDAWKPSPAGFQAIRGALGVPHEACAYVADNPAKDFSPANRLGWLTIRLLCEGQVHAGRPAPAGGEPHVTIAALEELDAVLG